MSHTSIRKFCSCLLLCWFAIVPGKVRADESDTPSAENKAVSFYKQIRPIVQAKCQGCHQPAKPSGNYIMTTFKEMLRGGESELAAIKPGQPEESYLIDLITPNAGKAEMPKKSDPLSEIEIQLIRNWIKQGAKNDTPRDAIAQYDAQHPPRYSVPPIVTALAYSPDGKLLAVSGFHEILIHKADGSGLVHRLIGMSERITSLAFSSDGKLLAATGGQPARMGEVQVWDVASGKLRLSHPVTYDTIFGASWSPDGKLIAFGGTDNAARAIDVATGKQVLFSRAHNDWVLDTTFSVDGSHLVSVGRDRSAKLVVVKTQRFVDNITSITPGALKGGLLAVDRHPKKDELVVGGADGHAKTYLMHRTRKRVIGDDYQKIRVFDKMPGRVFSVAYNHDGTKIVVGSSYNSQGEVRLYKESDSRPLWKFSGQPYYSVCFRPDGAQIAASGFDGKVQLLDTNNGKLVKEFVPVPIQSADKHEKSASVTTP